MEFFIQKLSHVFLPSNGNLEVGRVKQKLLNTCCFSEHTCSNLPHVACLEHNLENFNRFLQVQGMMAWLDLHFILV